MGLPTKLRATAARKYQTRLRIRNRKSGSGCQSFSSFIELWLAPSSGHPLVFDATQDDDAVDLCWGRTRWKFRFQRSEQDLADGKHANSQDRDKRHAATPTCQARACKTSRGQCHDHADDQPGFHLQGQPNELGKDEKRRVHRFADQLRCGRNRNWPTFERFLKASVCRPPTRLRRIASMSSSIFWRILAQLRLLTPPTRIL